LVDGLQHNLLSVSQLRDRGNNVKFSSDQCLITNIKFGDVVLRGSDTTVCIKFAFFHFPKIIWFAWVLLMMMLCFGARD